MIQLLTILWLPACGQVDFTEAEVAELARLADVPPAPEQTTNAWADDPGAAALGHRLFFDERLSGNGEVSCSTCHQPEHAFADPERLSTGVSETRRHAPSVLNAGHQRWLFWDGRADSLWAQALKPLEDPGEQAIDRAEVVALIASDPELRSDYEAVFGALPDEPQGFELDDAFAKVGKALEAYQRRLVTEPAPFDHFVDALTGGEEEGMRAMSRSAQRGARLFVGRAGCTQCHSGPLFTDHAFHNVGLGARDYLDPQDLGRFDGVDLVLADPFNALGPHSDDTEGAGALRLRTLANQDDFVGSFKTPTLRNVAESAPYMHGGHFDTLEDVIGHYNEIREQPWHGHREEILTPLDLDDRDVTDLAAFLESLSAPLVDPHLGEPPG